MRGASPGDTSWRITEAKEGMTISMAAL